MGTRAQAIAAFDDDGRFNGLCGDDAGDSVLAFRTAAAAINFKRSNTRQMAAGVLGAMAGDLRTTMLVLGDSLIAGSWSANNGLVAARPKSAPTMLAKALSEMGMFAEENWSIGTGGNATTATIASYDTRLTFGSSVTLATAYAGLGGSHWALGTDTVNGWIRHTARRPFDTVDILYMQATGTGSFTVRDQADALITTITTTGANGAMVATVTMPAGSTSVKLTTTGTNCMVAGIGTRNVGAPGIEVMNAGIHGINSGFFAVNPASGNNFANARAAMPKLFTANTRNVLVLEGGYNDIYSGYGQTLAQVADTYRSQIEFAKTLPNLPDVMGILYQDLGPITKDQNKALRDTIRDVFVKEYDLPVLDLSAVMPNVDELVGLGMAAADKLHLRAAGYAQWGKAWADAIMCVA